MWRQTTELDCHMILVNSTSNGITGNELESSPPFSPLALHIEEGHVEFMTLLRSSATPLCCTTVP